MINLFLSIKLNKIKNDSEIYEVGQQNIYIYIIKY